MVVWSFGNLLLSFGLSLWGEVMSFCLTPIQNQKSTSWTLLSKDRGRWRPGGAFQEAGPQLQGLSDAGHLQSQEKFPVGTFCSKRRDPTCAQHTRWATCSDTIFLPQFSPQTCKQDFSIVSQGRKLRHREVGIGLSPSKGADCGFELTTLWSQSLCSFHYTLNSSPRGLLIIQESPLVFFFCLSEAAIIKSGPSL